MRIRRAPLPRRIAGTLRTLVAGLDQILGANLTGIYLYGSLTQRAFRASASDIDLIVVVKRDLSAAQFDRLDAWLTDAARTDPWVPRLQMQILIGSRLLREDSRGALYQFRALKRSGSDGNPIIWLNVLASGLTLSGPRPQHILPPIRAAVVFAALVRELEYLRTEIMSRRSKWRDQRSYRAYAVLTLCRILYTHRFGKVASKPQAARWALGELPHGWHSLIRAAWPGSRATRRVLPLPRIARFIDYIRAQLDQPTATKTAAPVPRFLPNDR